MTDMYITMNQSVTVLTILLRVEEFKDMFYRFEGGLPIPYAPNLPKILPVAQ